MLEIPAQLWQRTKSSYIWRSFFRHGYPDSRKNQSLAVFTNVFLHLHPVKVRRHALAIPYTWCMGGLSFFLFLVLTLTGTPLLFFTIRLSYTGYRLPWDQLSFWAVTVGYEIARATPFIGDEFSFVLFGGYQLGPNALLRFYVLHVVGLPLVVGFLIAIHF